MRIDELLMALAEEIKCVPDTINSAYGFALVQMSRLFLHSIASNFAIK